MHAILAANLLPGLIAIGMLLGEICCVALGLAAIVLAALGRLRLAVWMAIPALAISIFATIDLVYFYYYAPDAPQDTSDFKFVWIFYSGIPLALSIFVGFLVFIRRRFAR